MSMDLRSKLSHGTERKILILESFAITFAKFTCSVDCSFICIMCLLYLFNYMCFIYVYMNILLKANKDYYNYIIIIK